MSARFVAVHAPAARYSRRELAQRRLSPVQIVIALAVILSGVLAMVPPFLRNLKASRLSEPLDQLGLIASRATALAAGRPTERAYPGAAPLTPANVPRGELVVDPSDAWEHPTWRELAFSVTEPHAYSFSFDMQRFHPVCARITRPACFVAVDLIRQRQSE